MKHFIFTLTTATLLMSVSVAQEKKTEDKKALEPARFWTDIVNDEKLENWRRGLAIYMLHERHVKKDITVGALANLYAKPTWLKAENIGKVNAIGGSVPIINEPGDTLFCIVFFPSDNVEKHNREVISLYVVVSGEIEEKTFVSTIMKREITGLENHKIKAWALSPTWNEHVKRIPR